MAADPKQDLWRFIRLDQYTRPPEPAQEKVRRGIFGLWDRLGWGEKSRPVSRELDLSQAPRELLDEVVPVPDWSEGIAAVTASLDDWLDATQPETPVQVFVGPSYSGTAQILAQWAEARGWDLLAPPEPEQILAGGKEWLAQVDDGSGAPLVLTHLEHCYLRHYDGLTMLRRLLEIILSHRRRWIVGCDSWAWAYFRQVFKVDAMLRSPWILAPFGQERLQVWLPEVIEGAPTPGFVFRQSDNGKFILPLASGGETELPDQDQPEPTASPNLSKFLKYLAAYSRGIPGIAWAVWRHSLYVAMLQEAEEKEAEKRAEEGGEPPAVPGVDKTIWVKPWHQIARPTVPSLPERAQLLMVLHALMLHGGLKERLFPKVLPMAPMEIIEYLYLLQNAGLVKSEQGFWRVTPEGYPAVRQELQSEGYLTDAI
ncbi:MAG: hypothetical protein Q7O12_03750 [Deltaproteobacteria bacterium]|nr:hypothetical protein [Deltaproteobacteria bacterium]